MLREKYLKEISGYIDKDFIKILIGMRRVGKSTILKQINEYLINEKKVKQTNIIYLNFELLENEYLSDIYKLNDYITNKCNNGEKYYLLFDEIQNVASWEKVINSLHAKKIFDIYITGSNSNLFSNEISTLIAGRYIKIDIKPFNFLEINEYYKEKGIQKTDLEIFNEYIEYGGLPQVLEVNKENKISVINGIFDSIILKDIIVRFNITLTL